LLLWSFLEKTLTSLWYGFELSADVQHIAITLSHTLARSIFSAKNKFCLKKLSLISLCNFQCTNFNAWAPVEFSCENSYVAIVMLNTKIYRFSVFTSAFAYTLKVKYHIKIILQEFYSSFTQTDKLLYLKQ